MAAITITLRQIRDASPCVAWWINVLRANGGSEADLDKPFLLSSVVDSNGISDTLWCLGYVLPGYHMITRRFALWCANQVRHLMTDQSSIDALDVAERYLDGKATREEVWDIVNIAQAADAKSRAQAGDKAKAATASYAAEASAEAVKAAHTYDAAAAFAAAYVSEAAAAARASHAYATDATVNASIPSHVAAEAAAEAATLSTQAAKLKAALDAGDWVAE